MKPWTWSWGLNLKLNPEGGGGGVTRRLKCGTHARPSTSNLDPKTKRLNGVIPGVKIPGVKYVHMYTFCMLRKATRCRKPRWAKTCRLLQAKCPKWREITPSNEIMASWNSWLDVHVGKWFWQWLAGVNGPCESQLRKKFNFYAMIGFRRYSTTEPELFAQGLQRPISVSVWGLRQ